MQRSESRILTTHTGSLPRPKALVDMQLRMSRAKWWIQRCWLKPWNRRHSARWSTSSDCGIDVGNDGEQPRESFFTYVRYRMSGFGGEGQRPPAQDVASYPTFRELFQRIREEPAHLAAACDRRGALRQS